MCRDCSQSSKKPISKKIFLVPEARQKKMEQEILIFYIQKLLSFIIVIIINLKILQFYKKTQQIFNLKMSRDLRLI